jgi:hypothetical protein
VKEYRLVCSEYKYFISDKVIQKYPIFPVENSVLILFLRIQQSATDACSIVCLSCVLYIYSDFIFYSSRCVIYQCWLQSWTYEYSQLGREHSLEIMISNAYTTYVCTQHESFRRRQPHFQRTETRFVLCRTACVTSVQKIFHTVSIQTKESLILADIIIITHSNISCFMKIITKYIPVQHSSYKYV